MKVTIRFLYSLLFLGLLLPAILQAQDKLYSDTFPLGDVQLLDGPFKNARDLNIDVLLQYDVDRFLAPYRKQAGLEPKAECYPNWEGLDGHVGGHYLSAMAMNWAATGNPECKKRMNYMVKELEACQQANAVNHPDWGVGYAGGMPNSEAIWLSVKSGDFGVYKHSWAPWYNLHKAYAGLRDAWLYGNNDQAKTLFLNFCDWAINLTSALSDSQMQVMLDSEHGGMPESFADAYQMSGDEKYLVAAKRFSHKALLDPLATGVDNLDNKHANTQVPKFVGFQRIAELSGNDYYHHSSDFFWHTVTDNRSLVFGGNSRKEHFPTVVACSDFVEDVDGPESCNTYNMLKLTEDLFRANPSAAYMDYYERALYNHILSTQHPEHGGYVYFTSARPRHYRVYSAPNMAMWCCVGTGMENHGKYNQVIYTHQQDSLYVNLFIASELHWKTKGIVIRQETDFPYKENTKLVVTDGSAPFTMMVRYPAWVADGALSVKVNGKIMSVTSSPGSYIAIDRDWKQGDEVKLVLPMHNTIEALPNVPEYVAFLHGPILLAAKTGTEDLAGLIAGDGRWDQYAHGEKLPKDKAPIIIADDLAVLPNALVPVKDKPLTYNVPGLKMINPIDVKLEPFFSLHDSRYMMYWMALSSEQYETYLDSLAAVETARMKLDKRTVDFVATGEQQPETDHAMLSEKSGKGTTENEFYRDARDKGYFSYQMSTNGRTDLTLLVRYWGYEWGSRIFDIYIDDVKLASEDNTGRWYQSQFQEVEYPIPESMLQGKDSIRVKFQAAPRSTAGAVYYLRLVKPQTN